MPLGICIATRHWNDGAWNDGVLLYGTTAQVAEPMFLKLLELAVEASDLRGGVYVVPGRSSEAIQVGGEQLAEIQGRIFQVLKIRTAEKFHRGFFLFCFVLSFIKR